MHLEEICEIIEKRIVGHDGRMLWIHAPKIASEAKPGQFVHISCNDFPLRRPISICCIEGEAFSIVFEQRGMGTSWLAQREAGGFLNIVGPCGNGFDIKDTEKKAFFVGGGIGTPPLLAAAKCYGNGGTAILGFRSRDYVLLEKEFQEAGARVILTSDDGSAGRKALVTEPLLECIRAGGVEEIYACGPIPMLKGVEKLALEYKIPCQISMEQRMGCGVGACYVCACKTKSRYAPDGWRYTHVCKNGPVYKAGEVMFE